MPYASEETIKKLGLENHPDVKPWSKLSVDLSYDTRLVHPDLETVLHYRDGLLVDETPIESHSDRDELLIADRVLRRLQR